MADARSLTLSKPLPRRIVLWAIALGVAWVGAWALQYLTARYVTVSINSPQADIANIGATQALLDLATVSVIGLVLASYVDYRQ